MDEEMKRAAERAVMVDGKISKAVLTKTIGDAVLALLESGRDCDRTALLQWFGEAITATPPGFRRQCLEDSQTALRDAMSRTG